MYKDFSPSLSLVIFISLFNINNTYLNSFNVLLNFEITVIHSIYIYIYTYTYIYIYIYIYIKYTYIQ